MDWRDRIVIDPKILVGKPVVRSTRLWVEFIVELVANGWQEEQLLESCPQISEPDIRACLAYAGELLREEHVYPMSMG